MPTYQYVCTECGGEIEAVQKFSDDPLTVHDACGGRLRKVFSPVGIVFKGSGFYRTDSRNSSSASTAAEKVGSASEGKAAADGKKDSGDAKKASGDGKAATSASSSGSAADSASSSKPAGAKVA